MILKMAQGFSFRSVILLWFCFASYHKILAQDTKVHWGLATPLAAKFQLLPSGGNQFNFWGSLGICLVNVIEGTDENALSILNKTGFVLDFTSYKTPAQGTLIMERASISFNPEIMFPTKMKRLKVTAGIGIDWNGYFLAQLENDGIYNDNLTEEMDQKRRKIFPFITAGLFYNLKNDFYLQVFIKQVMTGYYSKEAEIFFDKTASEPNLILNDKPTFAGFTVSYFFGQKS